MLLARIKQRRSRFVGGEHCESSVDDGSERPICVTKLSAATCIASATAEASHYCDGAHLDQVVWVRELAHFDQRGGWRRGREIFTPHLMDGCQVLHVAHIDIDTA